jgi:hypothetical protein
MKLDNKSLTPQNDGVQSQEFNTPAGIFIQEFDDHGNHRLIHKESGQTTHWAGYKSTCYLQGYVGYTGYYMDKEGVLPAEEFMKNTSVGAEKPRSNTFKRDEIVRAVSNVVDNCNDDMLMSLAECALNAEVVYDVTNEEFEVTPK